MEIEIVVMDAHTTVISSLVTPAKHVLNGARQFVVMEVRHATTRIATTGTKFLATVAAVLVKLRTLLRARENLEESLFQRFAHIDVETVVSILPDHI